MMSGLKVRTARFDRLPWFSYHSADAVSIEAKVKVAPGRELQLGPNVQCTERNGSNLPAVWLKLASF
ncbi:hypothetical protein JOB18_039796 [Solea senegalensis]|uniref:Uncharacterized protein n=1 Tax=Solea senegalensis TaxID=28829 RepID=A0AAV6SC27_SOLSE|nr:hypothetical protein JOB18_039796 [Solea senegalensis]